MSGDEKEPRGNGPAGRRLVLRLRDWLQETSKMKNGYQAGVIVVPVLFPAEKQREIGALMVGGNPLEALARAGIMTPQKTRRPKAAAPTPAKTPPAPKTPKKNPETEGKRPYGVGRKVDTGARCRTCHRPVYAYEYPKADGGTKVSHPGSKGRCGGCTQKFRRKLNERRMALETTVA